MQREPVILLVSEADVELEQALRRRYSQGYRVAAVAPNADPAHTLLPYREQGEQIALVVYEQYADSSIGVTFLDRSSAVFPTARRILLIDHPDPATALADINHHVIDEWLALPWDPPDVKLYPLLDDLLAEWRASVETPFSYVKGIMTVRAVRIRITDTLHRAAEVIALSGIGDLMVVDDDNTFVGVLSVGDVLRAAMPDVDEILAEDGTLEQAFRLFLRKGSELMYKPVEPLVIRNPLVVDPDDHVAKVAALMLETNIHRLPVVKDDRLIGTVGRTDICQAVVGTL